MKELVAWQAFVKTVEQGSMTAAARRLDCSRAQVSKLLAELEHGLGARLFERTTRRLSLTPAGEAFYPHALRVLADLQAAGQAVQELRTEPRGILRVTAPVTLGRLYIAPLLPQLVARYPELRCELVLNDRVVDLFEQGFDLALRLTDAPPPDLVARPLAETRRVICASPGYLARRGEPAAPEELADHDCFAYARARSDSRWRLRGPQGISEIAVRGPYQINHVEAIRDAVLAGDGIAILPTYLVADELRSGRLYAVLTDQQALTSFGSQLFACYPGSRVPLPRLQVFLAALQAQFSPQPPWEREK